MKIFSIAFLIVFIFIGGIYFFTQFIEGKSDNLPILIEKWDIQGNSIVMNLNFEVKEPLFLNKYLVCQTFDKNKNKLGIVKKKLRGDLKKSFTQVVKLGPVSEKTSFIDCSFVNSLKN